MKRHAFTLIELLVVIAIIAILAAILFPVFAQAKASAKAAADLSNVKQTGLAVIEYQSDNDDLCPLQAGQDTSGHWGYNYFKYVPYNWSSNPNVLRELYSSNFALNTIYPYTKSWKIFLSVGSSGIADSHFTGQTPVAGIGPQTTNLAYNGMLSAYSSTAVASVADLPMITEANGNIGSNGGGFANPALTCDDDNEPCTYQPATSSGCATGNGSTGAMYTTIGAGSYWVNKEGQNWCFTDGHAKFRAVGRSASGDWRTDPWTGYDNSGHAGSYWWDGCHPWLFRPDFDFNQ